jgi:antitoxin ParD1/3/4
MNVSLTKELEGFVHERVRTGRYHSASEVVREGLRLLESREQLRELQVDEMRRRMVIATDPAPRLADGVARFRPAAGPVAPIGRDRAPSAGALGS